MKIIKVGTKTPYNVYIGHNIIKDISPLIINDSKVARICIVTDDIVEKLYLKPLIEALPKELATSVFVVKNGENAKCSENLLSLWRFLAEKKLTRSDLIIALGGGVVGDLAGLAASTYLRGISLLQIPTTLLSQVDSSVGGKTAINISAGKNLVGTFYQPIAVLCDTATLGTLSDKIFSDGVAEIIKYGCIYDEKLFEEIVHIKNSEVLTKIISRCISIKAEVVETDEFDVSGRMLLNFGHTIGHAVERYYNFEKYTHGQAVAIGMVTICKLAENSGLTEVGTTTKIAELCERFNLPTLCEIDSDALLTYCLLDKKNLNSEINLILLNKIGSAYIKKLNQAALSDFLSQ